MAWTDEAWKAIEAIYQQILDLDFVKELEDGSLDQDRFLEYMVQDKFYLAEYSKAMALVAAHAEDPEDTAQWSKYSIKAATVEQTLHDVYLKSYDASPEVKEMLKSGTMNPTCELYTSFLLKHTALSPPEVGAAAILPCFWIYNMVGHHHIKYIQKNGPHKYAQWIEMYGSGGQDTDYAKAYCDKIAAKTTPEIRAKMTEAFVKASVMELMFWKAPWDKERWIHEK